MYTNIFAVVHVKTPEVCERNIDIARVSGFDGVFMISHGEMPNGELVKLASKHNVYSAAPPATEPSTPAVSMPTFGCFNVGVNLLGEAVSNAFLMCGSSMGMLWSDNAMVEDDDHADRVARARIASGFSGTYYGGVAFKYQAQPHDLLEAGRQSRGRVDVLTTSGDATGVPPAVDKLALLAEGFERRIGVASGVTAGNVLPMLPYVGHILVATGVSRDFHNLDMEKCRELVDVVRSAAA